MALLDFLGPLRIFVGLFAGGNIAISILIIILVPFGFVFAVPILIISIVFLGLMFMGILKIDRKVKNNCTIQDGKTICDVAL